MYIRLCVCVCVCMLVPVSVTFLSFLNQDEADDKIQAEKIMMKEKNKHFKH